MGILIEDEKAEYIIREHGVFPHEVHEVHQNMPRYFLRNADWDLYNMIGPSPVGRFMVVSIQPFSGFIYRLVTAYWSTDGRAEQLYRGS